MNGRGHHYISGCIFEENQANRGGAVSVGQKVDSFKIENSILRNNYGSVRGGAISISNISMSIIYTFF